MILIFVFAIYIHDAMCGNVVEARAVVSQARAVVSQARAVKAPNCILDFDMFIHNLRTLL